MQIAVARCFGLGLRFIWGILISGIHGGVTSGFRGVTLFFALCLAVGWLHVKKGVRKVQHSYSRRWGKARRQMVSCAWRRSGQSNPERKDWQGEEGSQKKESRRGGGTRGGDYAWQASCSSSKACESQRALAGRRWIYWKCQQARKRLETVARRKTV